MVHTTTTKENNKNNYLVSSRENIPGLKILSSVENVAKQEMLHYIVSTLATGTAKQQTKLHTSSGKKTLKAKAMEKRKTIES